jgi:hypothetical protein
VLKGSAIGVRLSRRESVTISAALSFQAVGLFPGRGAVRSTAALGGTTLGTADGPALAGMLLDAAGPRTGFLELAAPPAAVAAAAFAAGGARRLRATA